MEVHSSNRASGAHPLFYKEIYHFVVNGLVKISYPLSSKTAFIVYAVSLD